MKELVSKVMFGVLVGCLIGSCFASETLQQDAKPITVVYNNGDVEHYIVRWTGTRDINHYEDGHPSR